MPDVIKKTILIVEDEPGIADNIAFAVKTENMTPLHAPTAGAGWDFLQAQSVDLIVLDVGLPDESGFDFCRRVRVDLNTPIIFLTARSDELDRIVGLELGADDYMTKPFSPRELTARIRAILRRTSGPVVVPAAAVPESLFKVDQNAKAIYLEGERLELSRYEFRMLELMIRSPGQVFSRAQLMEHAWEDPDASYDRTVDTHIKTLRSKLREISPKSNYIKTQRGWGYSLNVDA